MPTPINVSDPNPKHPRRNWNNTCLYAIASFTSKWSILEGIEIYVRVKECVQQFHSPDCNRLYDITKALILNMLRSLAFQGKCLSIPEKRCLKDLNTCSTEFLLPNVSCWWGIPIWKTVPTPSWRTSLTSLNTTRSWKIATTSNPVLVSVNLTATILCWGPPQPRTSMAHREPA